KAGRAADRAGRELRAGDQPQGGRRARDHHSAVRAGAGDRGDRLNRRKFLLAVPALAAASRAQAQAGKTYRVGFILTTSAIAEMRGTKPSHPAVRGFLDAMRNLG